MAGGRTGGRRASRLRRDGARGQRDERREHVSVVAVGAHGVEVEREVLSSRGVEGFDPGLPPLRVWSLLLLLLMAVLG